MFEGLERTEYKMGETILREGEKGEIVGEMGLFANHKRIATATALEETRVVRINRYLIEMKLAGTDPVIKHLLFLVLQRLRSILYKFDVEKRTDSYK